MQRVLLILLMSFFCVPMWGNPLALSELIDMALKNNPETAKAWGAAKHAQAALGVGKSPYYPSLDAQGTLMHGREVKFPNGPEIIYTDYGGELSLSYLLYDFGERSASVQALKEALTAANWAADFTMQQVISNVCSNYYQYLNAVDLLRVKESTLKDYQGTLDAATEMHKVGLRSLPDLSLSKAEIAQLQMDVARQKAQVAISYGQLLTTLSVSLDTQIEVEENPTAISRPIFSEKLDDLIAMAKKQRSDLLAKAARLAEMEKDVKKASRAPLPKLRFVSQGGYLQYAKHKQSGYNYNVGLALEAPLFRGFEFFYRKRLAMANVDITAAELKELQLAVALEVLQYSEDVKAAREALEWSERYLEESTKTYEGVLEGYKAGLQNIFDLVQSQRILADARIRKTQARTEWLVSLAQLAFATGTIR